MDKHEFPLNSYITLCWQPLLISMGAAWLISRLLEKDIAWVPWLLPPFALAMTLPYITRLGEMAADLRRGSRQKARLRLKDVSEEFALAIHRQRGLHHWTLIFEDEARPGTLLSLSAAARRDDMRALFELETSYSVEWLPASRVIKKVERA